MGKSSSRNDGGLANWATMRSALAHGSVPGASAARAASGAPDHRTAAAEAPCSRRRRCSLMFAVMLDSSMRGHAEIIDVQAGRRAAASRVAHAEQADLGADPA